MDLSAAGGLEGTKLVERHFTTRHVDPFDEGQITWTERDVWVGTQYEHLGVEAPDFWSDNAVSITSKLYLSKAEGSRENSVRDLVTRVAKTIANHGLKAGYFGVATEATLGQPAADRATTFYDELRHIMINQLGVFNSPVLFNVGRDDREPQVSACFILGVEDTTDSIKATASREIDIFRGGSGSGSDLSRMRGSMEPLSGGGTSSGPVSFMRFWDAGAGTFKSGGKTRRAAILRKLDADHPDIRDFITCKVREEERLYREREAGTNIGFDAEGERNVAEMTSFQNANNSVGTTDEFMQLAYVKDPTEHDNWPLYARSKTWRDQHGGNAIVGWDNAGEILELMADSAWHAACPGIFYMDKIQSMHTAPILDGVPSPIRSSNPCGEFLHNDETSCNLGSINILKFVKTEYETDVHDVELQRDYFDVRGFRHVVDVMTVAMEILVDLGHFPDPAIEDRSRKLRPLGLGYSNMGAAIMAQGYAYDSDEGRDFAASVTALETGRVYRKSGEMAWQMGAFHYFDENRDAMLGVIEKHSDAIPHSDDPIWMAAAADWIQAMRLGVEHGFRNSQASVIPPAGTTSFFLDCDTTGIEPAFLLATYKELAGGGTMTLVNQSVTRAANALGGYSVEDIEQMNAGDFSCCSPEDEAVFHTANEISWQGHVKMMAAVQPFVSGAISKTINMPHDATPQDVKDAYVLGWRLGLKDLAVYRNGSKARQPHSAAPKVVEKMVVDDVELERNPDDEPKLRTAGEIAMAAIESFEKHHENDVPADQIRIADATTGEVFKVTGRLVASGSQVTKVFPVREKMPRTRRALNHKVHLRGQIGDYEGYVHAGLYEDGRLGEMFISGFGRSGSFTVNALQSWATDFSIAIQYGIDWRTLARKHLGVTDETGGMVVPDPDVKGPMPIRSAKSIIDYVVRWLALEFGDDDDREEFGVRMNERRDVTWSPTTPQVTEVDEDLFTVSSVVDSTRTNGKAREVTGTIACSCGGIMQPTGGCFTCTSCFTSTGCG